MSKQKVFLRTEFNYDSDTVSFETGLVCDEISLTQQSFADECDINEIVRRFGITGQMPSTVKLPSYGDFTGVSDYQTALHVIMEAEDNFMSLPADIRSKFDNDPQVFLDFCENPDNLNELRSMGLAKPDLDSSASGTEPNGQPSDSAVV